MQEESDSEDRSKETTSPTSVTNPSHGRGRSRERGQQQQPEQQQREEGMGNQAQRRTVLRIRRASSEESQPRRPSPSQDAVSGFSPTASPSPAPGDTDYDFIGPFGKKQKIIRARLKFDDSSGSESATQEDTTTTSTGSSHSRTRDPFSHSPQGPSSSRASVILTSSPGGMGAIFEEDYELAEATAAAAAASASSRPTAEPLNLSMFEELPGSRASRLVQEESQSRSPTHSGSPHREFSVITATPRLSTATTPGTSGTRRVGRPTNASYAAEAAAADAAVAGPSRGYVTLPSPPGSQRVSPHGTQRVSPQGSQRVSPVVSVEKDSKGKAKKKYKCEDCNKEFSQLRNFRYHRSRHEGTNQFACTCPICGKKFNDKGYLSSHLKIHKNAKEYKCEWCEKSFNQRVAYNMHVRIHTGLKPHQCHLCPKAFSRKMLLRQHLRTHTGERPYHCLACPKSFADRSNMLLHQRLHTGERPYHCEICGKSFSKNHHLKTHMNHHLGIRPYACPKCDSRFSQSSNMKTHLKKCTGVKQKPRASGPRGNYPQVGVVGATSSSSGSIIPIIPAAAGSAVVTGGGQSPQGASAEPELSHYMNPMMGSLPGVASIRRSVTPPPAWSSSSEYAPYSSIAAATTAVSPTVIRGPSPIRRRIPPSSTVTTDSQPTAPLQLPAIISPPRGTHTIHYRRGEGHHPSMVPLLGPRPHSAGGAATGGGGGRPPFIQHLPLSLHTSPPHSVGGPGNRRIPPAGIIPIHPIQLEGYSTAAQVSDIHSIPLYSYAGLSRQETTSQQHASGSTPSSPSAVNRSPPNLTQEFLQQLQQQQQQLQFLQRQQQQLQQAGYATSTVSSAHGSRVAQQQQQQLTSPRSLKRELQSGWDGEGSPQQALPSQRQRQYHVQREIVRPPELYQLDIEEHMREIHYREIRVAQAAAQHHHQSQQLEQQIETDPGLLLSQQLQMQIRQDQEQFRQQLLLQQQRELQQLQQQQHQSKSPGKSPPGGYPK